jgi:restriction system protein
MAMVAAAKIASPDFLTPAIKGLVHGFVAVWPVWLIIGAIALAKLAHRIRQARRLAKSGIGDTDHMDGETFEQFLGAVFRRLGYRVEITRYRGDYGADLVVSKNGVRTAVQAKRWNKRVGLKAVQEAVASKGLYECDEAMVVANREFTQQARRLARANKVALWDRSVLVDKLLVTGESEASAATPQRVLAKTENGATATISEAVEAASEH